METTAQPITGMPAAGTADALFSPDAVWEQVTKEIRREVDVPTVWLTMQAARPLAIDGRYFVAALPAQMQYLATNLESAEYSILIEEALHKVTGRVLAFQLIEGETLDDWEAQKQRNPAKFVSPPPTITPPPPEESFTHVEPRTAPAPRQTAGEPGAREISASWEKLNERLTHGYKNAPYIKYAHGQARYLIECVQAISDTMDVLMPGPGEPRNEPQERQLARTIERLGNVMSLDPLFVALELMRYRLFQGKDIGLPQ